MKCPVCLNPSTVPALSGTDFLFETSDRTFFLNACSACDCLFLNPLPDDGEIAGFYPSQYWWSASGPALLKRLESVYRKIALRDHIAFVLGATSSKGRPIRLLDVGCGSGTFIALLEQRGFVVLGIDASAEAAQVASVEHGVHVLVGTLEKLDLVKESFDIVTLFHVMEHVTNPRQILGTVHGILKSDGCVVLQVPNIDSWQFKWFGARWYGLDIPRHVIDYSSRSILNLLKATGYEVKRVRYFNLRDNSPALVSSLLPSLDPLSRPIRLRRRSSRESAIVSWLKHVVYLVLVCCAYPVTLLEAAFGHGATIMIEAHKK